jgi:hypothetical protein
MAGDPLVPVWPKGPQSKKTKPDHNEAAIRLIAEINLVFSYPKLLSWSSMPDFNGALRANFYRLEDPSLLFNRSVRDILPSVT